MLVRTKGEPIQDICDLYNMSQLINEPTNITIHGKSLIDIILSSEPDLCLASGTEYVGVSDSHNMIYVVLNTDAPRLPPKTVTYRNYKNFKVEQYKNDINNIPSSACQVFDDPSDNYWLLQSLLLETIDHHAPLKTIKIRAREPPYMTGKYRRAVREKTRLHRKYKRFPNWYNWEMYRLHRNLTTSIRRSSIKQYFDKRCAGKNNADFWKTIKPFLTNKGANNSNPICIKSDDVIITDPKIVANKINQFYVNIASNIGKPITLEQNSDTNVDFVLRCSEYFKDHPSIVNISTGMDKYDFSLTHTTPDIVEKAISNLDTTKSTGCDMIPAKLLKPIASHISHHMTQIFNQSVDTCIFPENAKMADVVPLFKKGDNLQIKKLSSFKYSTGNVQGARKTYSRAAYYIFGLNFTSQHSCLQERP